MFPDHAQTIKTAIFYSIFSVCLSRELPAYPNIPKLKFPTLSTRGTHQTDIVDDVFSSGNLRNYTSQLNAHTDAKNVTRSSSPVGISSSSSKKDEMVADAPAYIQENNGNQETIVGISDILQINFVPFLIDNVISPLITHVLADGNIYSYLNGTTTASVLQRLRRNFTTSTPQPITSTTQKESRVRVTNFAKDDEKDKSKPFSVSTTDITPTSSSPTKFTIHERRTTKATTTTTPTPETTTDEDDDEESRALLKLVSK